jgi:hypothetical protein
MSTEPHNTNQEALRLLPELITEHVELNIHIIIHRDAPVHVQNTTDSPHQCCTTAKRNVSCAQRYIRTRASTYSPTGSVRTLHNRWYVGNQYSDSRRYTYSTRARPLQRSVIADEARSRLERRARSTAATITSANAAWIRPVTRGCM